jgi:hypothetical protein
MLQNSENPTLNLGLLAVMRFNLRAEELFQAAIGIRRLKPFGGSKGVLLVGRTPSPGKVLLQSAG